MGDPTPMQAAQLHEPSPADAIDSERLIKALLRKADQARRDPATFFTFALREERTLARVQAAPHQRLLFAFVRHYDQCVVRMPIGSSKTFCMAALTLWLLGNDPTERGAIISATQGQAAKPLSMVADYLNEPAYYPELSLVFPELKPSRRRKDPWTQTRLVVDRPPGIRDPSLVAVGMNGALPGARLSWILCDDLLSEENTRTAASRQKVSEFFYNTVLSRKDVVNAKIVVTNTPHHPKDLTYQLEKAGWPTLTMSIEGEITLTNAEDFDSDELRPTEKRDGVHYRLAAHDVPEAAPAIVRKLKKASGIVHVPFPAVGAQVVQTYRTPDGGIAREAYDASNDNAVQVKGRKVPGVPLAREHYDLDELVPLWPAKFRPEDIEYLKTLHRNAYPQLYLCVCRDDETALCKESWIEQAKEAARALGFHHLVREYRGPNLVVTGLDLAIGEGEEHDQTAFFTFEVIPLVRLILKDPNGVPVERVIKNARRILDVEVGRFRGRAVVDKLIDKVRRFGSIVRVETNGGQDFLRQWTIDADTTVPVRAHHTTAAKGHRVRGVASLFIELENGAWIVPCDERGQVAPAVQLWIDDCLNYRPPPAHTGDSLMASYLGREEARLLGAFGEDDGGSVAAAVGAR